MAERKRGRGEGSIYQRADGRWCASVRLGRRGGKPVRKVVYGSTRQEAQAKLAKLLARYHVGENIVPERMKLGQFLDWWLDTCVAPSTRPRTLESYSYIVRVHLKPALGEIELAKLGPEHVQRFITDKLKARAKPRLVAYMHRVLNMALGRAVKFEYVARNVAKLVEPPRVERKRVEPLNPEEARRLTEACENHPQGALVALALGCGLRKGEILGLKWSDLDLEKGVAQVRRQVVRIKGSGLVEQAPKSERSRRVVALPTFVVRALRAHRKRQLEVRLLAGSRWQEKGYVFTTGIGTPLDEARVSRVFRQLLRAAGLPRKRFHDLRHTAASLLLASGIHPRVVMEILGHSQFSFTMDTYSHVMPPAVREAAEKLDRLLG